MSSSSDVEQLTELLRHNQDEFWIAVRNALIHLGIDPVNSALAELVQQGTDSEFGVIVTPDERVLEFSLVGTPGVIVEWVNVTSWWRDTSYQARVAEAFSILGLTP